tara:strand:+ start:34 stop:210 length:177 start_codon:yes stop_codon:yes gene_type:complete
MKNKEEALKLLDQIMEGAKLLDEENKKLAIANGKSARTLGESWLVFHLKVLRDLIEEN